jgi:hypothetical protein
MATTDELDRDRPIEPAAVAPRSGPAPTERNAIVFVPGMGDDWVDQSIQGIGARFAHALNRSVTSAGARFPVELEVRQEPFGVKVSACTISRDDGQGESPAVDVFKLDAVRTLRSRHESSSLLWRMVLPVVFILIYLRGVVTAFARRAGKTRRERYQVFFATSVLLLMTGYVAFLLFTAIKTAFPDAFDWFPTRLSQGLVVGLTALGLWKSGLVSGLGRAAVGYTCVIGYLGFGDRRDQLVGQLNEVLDRIQEQQDVRYRRIDVVAYSFGTIVAIDAFFPRGGSPSIRLRDVDTLVMVGCPFDFVRTYWPRYFNARSAAADVPRNWLNFYTPIDILASNFRADGEIGEPEQGIPTDGDAAATRKPTNVNYGESRSTADVGPLEFVTFLGLRSHSFYWGRTDEREETVFVPIVSTLYAGEPILG